MKNKNGQSVNGREVWLEEAPIDAQMIVTDGGVGDLIAELVAVNYNVQHSPTVKWTLFCPDYLKELAENLIPGLKVVPFSRAPMHFKPTAFTRTTEWCWHSPMRTHPVDYGFHMLADKHIDDVSLKNYLRIKPVKLSGALPKKYVCIAATGVEPCKTLPGAVIDEIADYCISLGHTPVYLGKRESDTGHRDLKVKSTLCGADLSKGLDLLDKTTLVEAATIIDGSRAWIGMDGGLMHLAGCTDAHIVCGFTLVEPKQVAPYRYNSRDFRFHPVEPSKNIQNRYYQSYTNVATPGDYRKFPGWEAVLADLTADKFIHRLQEVL